MNDPTPHTRSFSPPDACTMANALHDACVSGDIDVVRDLLDGGADIEALRPNTSTSMTPLHRACHNGRIEVVRLLLSRGANVEAYDHHNRTPFERVAYRGQDDYDSDCSEGDDEVTDADTRMEIVREMLDKGASVGDACVQVAAMCGNVMLAQELLERGYDIEELSSDGTSALHQAIDCRNIDMVRFLIENEADVTAEDVEGITPLSAAAGFNWPELKEAVEEALANALHVAIELRSIDHVRFMIQNGADVTAEDNEGITPLQAAASLDWPELREAVEEALKELAEANV